MLAPFESNWRQVRANSKSARVRLVAFASDWLQTERITASLRATGGRFESDWRQIRALIAAGSRTTGSWVACDWRALRERQVVGSRATRGRVESPPRDAASNSIGGPADLREANKPLGLRASAAARERSGPSVTL